MTDLEMTKLCAKAIGINVQPTPDAQKDAPFVWHYADCGHWAPMLMPYNPLHNDEQAMALVKKFDLSLNGKYGEVVWFDPDSDDDLRIKSDGDLNRAIVECVAKMQKAKVSA